MAYHNLRIISVVIFTGIFMSLFTYCSVSGEYPKVFTMRTGVNVSHWLSQSTKLGEERRNYIIKADFDTIASAGFDHVRIPIDEVQMWDSLGNKEAEAFELAAQCHKLGIGSGP